MTLLVSWLAVDSRRPSTVYIATDSRISWSKAVNFDQGKKVFAFKNSPDIIGYCGDVLFPMIVLSQLVELADAGLLFDEPENCDAKFQSIKDYLENSLSKYPIEEVPIYHSIEILYASRDSNHQYHVYTLTWLKHSNSWYARKIELSTYSNPLAVLGTGAGEFQVTFEQYKASDIQKTSRAIFQSFCDTLSAIDDVYCGGAPQLVGLYQKWNGINFGIIFKGKRYLCGLEVRLTENLDLLAWRNEEFEVCSGLTMKRKPKAQRQPNPIILKRGNSLTVH